MKSERRHKLQENSLAHSLENLPKMGKESGSKLLLGIVTALLIVVLIRYYLNSKQQKKEMIAAELTDARYDLADLNGGHTSQRQLEVQMGERQAVELSPDERKKLLNEIDKKVDAVEAETTDTPQVAEAKNIRADAYVHVAALGNPPGATTRPELALPRSPEDLLDEAARTYQQVLDMKDGLPESEAADAHFGLGAIAEDHKDWDKARSQYDAVAKDPGMPKAFKDYAAVRLQVLDQINKPFLVGKPVELPRPTTGPATAPAAGPPTGPTSAPAAGPTSEPATPESPATRPAAPTTGPTTSGT